MNIKLAESEDIPIVHEIMIKAFDKYRDDAFPSSALEETIESISAAMNNGELAFIYYQNERPVGMVRFLTTDDSIYFYRLSVIPEQQGKGIAKNIIAHLEKYAKEIGVVQIHCNVRYAETQNILLYHSIGYSIDETSFITKQQGQMKIVSMKKILVKS